ncbi:uncharacterized protein [Penaeus vannamei]|uniref:uncharacterized protein n=1 Tax=Penaeus vannamei TaxID=6689 RepID=UPI00387F89CA
MSYQMTTDAKQNTWPEEFFPDIWPPSGSQNERPRSNNVNVLQSHLELSVARGYVVMRVAARGRAGGPPPPMLVAAFVLLASSAQFSEMSSSVSGDLAPQQESVRLAQEKADALYTQRNSSFVFSNTSSEFRVGGEWRKALGSVLTQRQGRDICSQKKFSSLSQFLQHSKMCFNVSVSGVSRPGSKLQLCFNKYRQIHNNQLPPTPVMYYLGKGKYLKIFYQRDFIDVCLPLFRQYGICKEKRYSTFCVEDLTLFLHTRWCQRPSEEDKYFEVLWAVSLMRNDYECFDHICDGSYRVIVRKVNGIVVQLLRLDQGHTGKSCSYLYKNQELKAAMKNDNMTAVWTGNMFFPCCYSLYHITWLGLPEEKGLNRFWDYLPLSCRVGEIVMATSVAFIGVFGAIGNLLVVTVILRSDRRSEESSILRTSLAFADLFTSVFVVIPAFYDHLLPIMGRLDFDKYSVTVSKEAPEADIRYEHLKAVSHGYHLFEGLVLGVCSFVSLLTLFLLSVERYILAGRVLRYQHYFTVPRVKIAIFLTWSVAVIDTLFYMYDGDGSFSVTWSSLLKLPISTSFKKIGGVLRWTYSIHIFVLSVLCVLTVITSLVSIGTFVQEQAKVVAGWKKRNMRVSGPYQKENRQILTTMCILTFLFMLSTLPVGAFIVVNLTDTFFVQEDLSRYLGWWTFLSGCSWNPWVYNMRSRQFRQEVGEVLRAMLPLWLRRRVQRPEADERQMERRRAQMRMLRRLDLID